MNFVQCQFMTVIIVLLIINLGLVIGVFLKWRAAKEYCIDGAFYRSLLMRNQNISPIEDRSAVLEHPFAVGIAVRMSSYGPELHCGGVIIEEHWVVTAGHCVEMLMGLPYENVFVYGGNALWKIALRHNVVYMIYHSKYDSDTFHADIGLVKVEQPFRSSFEWPIAIASPSYEYEENATVTALGWSVGFYTEDYKSHNVLSSVTTTILNADYCKELYKKLGEEITGSMLCAGTYIGKKPACHLDSGGPLLDGDLLIGVVSWGRDCGKVDQPTVYTRISPFSLWIQNVVQPKSPVWFKNEIEYE